MVRLCQPSIWAPRLDLAHQKSSAPTTSSSAITITCCNILIVVHSYHDCYDNILNCTSGIINQPAPLALPRGFLTMQSCFTMIARPLTFQFFVIRIAQATCSMLLSCPSQRW